MTIKKTVDQIGTYSEQMERQLANLAKVEPSTPTTAGQAGKPPSSTELLMSVFSDHLVNAAERLKAVHQATGQATPSQPLKDDEAGTVIDVTEYREITDEST